MNLILGITLDYKLKWAFHINNLILNLRKFFFWNVKRYFNIKIKRMIYIALVQFIYSYGIMFWGCAYNTHLKKLKVTINSIFKLLLSKPKHFSTKLIFNELNVQYFNKIFFLVNYYLIYKKISCHNMKNVYCQTLPKRLYRFSWNVVYIFSRSHRVM